ncbi:TonB-dependent receptor [Haloflavibacter putidus]|nr:TonB-dependent receptor [Haloflavibacter putidus]
MKFIVSVIILLMANYPAFAQECNYTLSGKLTDFHNGDPLIYAEIILQPTGKTTYSNFDGEFSIENLCAGQYEITVKHPQCDTKSLDFSLTEDKHISVKLEHHLEELGEVLLQGKKQLALAKTGQEASLKTAVLEKYSNANLGDALKEISGVSTLSTGNSIVKPVIHGLHSSRVLTFNNGVKMEDQEWGVEHAPNIDLNTAGSVSVIKGASALAYGGDAVGGVVLTKPNKIPVIDSLYGKTILSASTNGRGGTVTTELIKAFANGWYAKAQGSFKKYGDFEAPNYVLSNTGNQEQNFALNFGLNKFTSGFDAYYSFFSTETGILRSAHIGNVNDLIKAINQEQPFVVDDFTYSIDAPKQEVKHHLLKLNYFKRFAELGKLELQYSYQKNDRQEYDIRRDAEDKTAAVDLELESHKASATFKFDAENDFNLNTGLEVAAQNNFSNPSTGVRRLIPDYDKQEIGVFAVADYKFKENWLLEGGLRYDFTHLDAKKFYLKSRWEERNYDTDYANIIIGDYGTQYLTNPIFDYHSFSYSAGIKYEVNQYNFAVNYAKANRAPNPAELFSDGLHHSAAIIELGDLRFDKENAHKISLSLERKTDAFSLSVEPYYNFLNNFIVLQPIGLETTIRGAFPVWEYQQTKAEMYGVDVSANYSISSNFLYQTRFASVHGKNKNTNTYLVDMPPSNWSNTINFTKPEWYNLDLSLTGDWVFKKQNYPDNNFYYDVLEDGNYTSTFVDISTPPNAYFLLHFNAFTSFKAFKTGQMQVSLLVNNLLNTSYRDYLNRLRYYADNTGRNFTLQLKLNY